MVPVRVLAVQEVAVLEERLTLMEERLAQLEMDPVPCIPGAALVEKMKSIVSETRSRWLAAVGESLQESLQQCADAQQRLQRSVRRSKAKLNRYKAKFDKYTAVVKLQQLHLMKLSAAAAKWVPGYTAVQEGESTLDREELADIPFANTQRG